MSTEALEDLVEYISEALPEAILSHDVIRGEPVVHVRRDQIVRVMQYLRDDRECHFEMLADLCGADYPDRPERFEIVYNLLSLRHNARLRVKVTTDEDTPVPSVAGVYAVANWYEREVWDLFGVIFSGHPDLRRILTDYGFEGHPLRKDFPLTGFVELRYDSEARRVVYEPVTFTQDFRRFDFLSPWEGMTTVQLAGDEKAIHPDFGWVPSEREVKPHES